MSTSKVTHMLIIPHPAQGHLLPLLDLTHHLCLRGLHVTVLITPKNLPFLTHLLSSYPSIQVQTLVLPLPPHPKLPPGLENINQIGPRGNFPIASALSSLSSSISDWFNSHPSPPHGILSDFFLGWTLDLAHSLSIPRFAFFSSGSFLSSVLASLFSDLNNGAATSDPVEFAGLPGSPVFPEAHLPSIFRFYDESNPDSRLFKNGFLSNLSSHGCVFNSFRDLESPFLDHFQRITSGHGRIYAVGPTSLLAGSANGSTNSKVLTWLDGSPDGSVLYVSFGSQKWLTEPQLQVLGRALEKSGTRFIWVVRTGPESNLGFLEEQVAGRGLVIKGWAPQVEILGHRAVGGFLSHCGWNSVLESVVAGVMILAWPMEADQFVNARLLVEEIGVAVRVCEGADTVPDPDEMGRVIREAMGLDVLLKRKATEMKVKAVAAVKEGGTSAVELDDFVNELLRIGST